LPKRGFTNIFKKEYTIVNLTRLAELGEKTITPDVLYSKGVLKSRKGMVKILGVGELSSALTVHAHKFSESAQEKITKAGGKAEVISAEKTA
jgi:large subunit ribosomal protein L15